GDITRDVIAGLLGEELTVDPDLKREIIELFSRRGMEMPENNIRQATIIPSAVALRNSSGTAPGWWVEKEGRIIVTLPGPPAELQSMWNYQVLPRLKEKSGAIIVSRTIKTWGLSEAKVDEMVSPFLSTANPTLAMYAGPEGIRLRITAKADTEEAAGALITEREKDIRGILDNYIWGADDETLEGIIGRLLRSRGMTLAVAESFTGGLLAGALTGVPESRDFFRGGIIVPAGAAEASAESAAGLANKARREFAADVGIAIDGNIKDADDNTRDAVYIAVDTASNQGTIKANYPARLPYITRRIISHALIYLRDFIRS
ncbi:MAG: CinA family protein, partial [Dehalococcoidales bacterium]|nr:CinA family protein [Dehalococcoidales bacterium]